MTESTRTSLRTSPGPLPLNCSVDWEGKQQTESFGGAVAAKGTLTRSNRCFCYTFQQTNGQDEESLEDRFAELFQPLL